MFKDLQKVYVELYHGSKEIEHCEGVVICDIGVRRNNKPGTIYAVRFVKDGDVYERALFAGNLSERQTGSVGDERLSFAVDRDWLSPYAFNRGFRSKYLYGVAQKQRKAREAVEKISSPPCPEWDPENPFMDEYFDRPDEYKSS